MAAIGKTNHWRAVAACAVADAIVFLLVLWIAEAITIRAVGANLPAFHLATFALYQLIVIRPRHSARQRGLLASVGMSVAGVWLASTAAAVTGLLLAGPDGLGKALRIDPLGAVGVVVLAVPARTGAFIFGVASGVTTWLFAYRKAA